jgi:indolepyruvate ferredoxin oxidoreductase beta subunit
MVKHVTNVVICGVGGQGIILASDVLCSAAFYQGRDVKKSEVHGMAQRGGSVITHVRFGPKIYSPLIEEGRADFILAFEKLEALRYINYLKRKGVVIVDDREIPPMSVLVGSATYPADIDQRLKRHGVVHPVEATRLANFMGFAERSWHAAIRDCVKEKFVDLNIAAFEQGRRIVFE